MKAFSIKKRGTVKKVKRLDKVGTTVYNACRQ